MSSRRRAFTLVELLVVIAIIAILISILLPILAKAKEAANRTKCASNMQQLGMVFIQYHAEFKGYLPCAGHDPGCGIGSYYRAWVTWFNTDQYTGSLVAHYLSKGTTYKVLLCPSDDPNRRGRMTFGIRYPYSYALNDTVFKHWSHWNMQPPKSEIFRESDKILAIEESWKYIDKGCFDAGEFVQFKGDILSNVHDKNHGNVLFADGHVDFVSRDFINRAASARTTSVRMGTNEYTSAPYCLNPLAN